VYAKYMVAQVNELAKMSEQEVSEHRKQLNGIKVRGKEPQRPIKNWNQCGLSGRVLDVIRKSGFDSPMPIQAQALPIIMSGRDCIGIAETGSGKTLAFVLPMLRHIKDQPPLQQGDGPIALVVAPTRELVQQISKDTKKFCKVHSMLVVAVYGGSGVANQITELKRGAEIVVCTPGRMIDILVTSAGKITNLRRVTYLVFDEADRMFDMGFEPQISRIHRNIRPSRQTVMFSATFPRSVGCIHWSLPCQASCMSCQGVHAPGSKPHCHGCLSQAETVCPGKEAAVNDCLSCSLYTRHHTSANYWQHSTLHSHARFAFKHVFGDHCVCYVCITAHSAAVSLQQFQCNQCTGMLSTLSVSVLKLLTDSLCVFLRWRRWPSRLYMILSRSKLEGAQSSTRTSRS